MWLWHFNFGNGVGYSLGIGFFALTWPFALALDVALTLKLALTLASTLALALASTLASSRAPTTERQQNLVPPFVLASWSESVYVSMVDVLRRYLLFHYATMHLMESVHCGVNLNRGYSRFDTRRFYTSELGNDVDVQLWGVRASIINSKCCF